MYRYFKDIVNTDHISSWKSKRLSDEIMKPPTASANSLSSALSYKYSAYGIRFDIKGTF